MLLSCADCHGRVWNTVGIPNPVQVWDGDSSELGMRVGHLDYAFGIREHLEIMRVDCSWIGWLLWCSIQWTDEIWIAQTIPRVSMAAAESRNDF